MSKWEMPGTNGLPRDGRVLTPLLWILRTFGLATLGSVIAGWAWVWIATAIRDEAVFVSWVVGFVVGVALFLFGPRKGRLGSRVVAVVFTVVTVLICRYHISDELVRLHVVEDTETFEYVPDPEMLEHGLTAEQIKAAVLYRTYELLAAEKSAIDYGDLFWIPFAALTAFGIGSRRQRAGGGVVASSG